MKSLSIHSTGLGLITHKILSIPTQNFYLKRFTYNLRVNILPTAIFLVILSIISLYVSEVIYQAKKQKLAQDGNLAVNTN